MEKNDIIKDKQEYKATPLYIEECKNGIVSPENNFWSSNKYTHTIRPNNPILRHIFPGKM